MKKFAALLLAMALLCGAALASEITDTSASKQAETSVTFTIAPNVSYIVTIPPTVDLKAADGNATGVMTIKISAPKFNDAQKAIAVALTSSLNGFNLVYGAEKLPYAVALDGAAVKAGDRVLLWSHANNGADVSADLTLSTSYSINQTAGQYTDTITFTVSVIDRP